MSTLESSQIGSERKKSGFSLFSRPKNGSTTVSAISAPLAMSSSAGVAAGIPGFIPTNPAQKIHHSTAAKQRVAEWASTHSKAPQAASELRPFSLLGSSGSVKPLPAVPVPVQAHKQTQQTLLLPTSFSTGSGLTASSSVDCISASTSRNTVLPALHPVMNTTASGKDIRASTFLPPSASGGGGGMASLGSAIKLGPNEHPVEGNNGRSSIIRAKAVTTQEATLPRSTSGTSIFSNNRPSNRKVSAAGEPGESLGRRISRRLSIDGFRPRFGTSAKRHPSGKADAGVSEFGALIDPPVQPAAQQAIAPPSAAPGKDKMMLPAFRSWRSRFKAGQPATMSSVDGSKAHSRQTSSAVGDGSVRSKSKRDSWVDVGSMRSRLSKASPITKPRPFSTLDCPDERIRPIGVTGLKPRVFTSGSEHENAYRRQHPELPVTAEDIDAKIERLISKHDIDAGTASKTAGSAGDQGKDSPGPARESAVSSAQIASASTTSLIAPTTATAPRTGRLSPARDDMSVLDPLQSRAASPEPPLPPLPAAYSKAVHDNVGNALRELPSSRSLNAIDSLNIASLAQGDLEGAEKVVNRKRSLAAVGSSTFSTTDSLAEKEEGTQDRGGKGAHDAPAKSRPVSTITTFEADVAIVTATRHERLPFARSYSASIADHLSILSASSSGLDASGLIDSRASLASIAAGTAQRDQRPDMGRDDSVRTFHTAPSAASVSGLPPASPSRQAVSRANSRISEDRRVKDRAGARIVDELTESPSLIQRTEEKQGEGWWSVSRTSRLAPTAIEPVSPTSAGPTKRLGQVALADSPSRSRAYRPATTSKSHRTTGSLGRSALQQTVRLSDTAGNGGRQDDTPRRAFAAPVTRTEGPSQLRASYVRARSSPALTSKITAAPSQASIAVSLICPSPSASPASAHGTDNRITAKRSPIPLVLQPPPVFTSRKDPVDPYRELRRRHDADVEMILDSLYKAKYERDQALNLAKRETAKIDAFLAEREVLQEQIALLRGEKACEGDCVHRDSSQKEREMREELHDLKILVEQLHRELLEKSIWCGKVEHDWYHAENRIKQMRSIVESCGMCRACLNELNLRPKYNPPEVPAHRKAGARSPTDWAKRVIEPHDPDPRRTEYNDSRIRSVADRIRKGSPALPSVPSDILISRTTPLPEIHIADPVDPCSTAGSEVSNIDDRMAGSRRGSDDMSRSTTGSGSETVCEADNKLENTGLIDATR